MPSTLGERAAELRSLDESLSERRAQSKRRKEELKAAGKSLSEVEKKIRLRRQEIVKLQAAEADAKRRLDQVKGSSKDRGAELNRLDWSSWLIGQRLPVWSVRKWTLNRRYGLPQTDGEAATVCQIARKSRRSSPQKPPNEPMFEISRAGG